MQTVGNALGAPLCGWVIDRVGAGGGFLTAAVVGGGVAGLGLVVVAVRRRRPAVLAPAGAVDDVPAVPSSPAVVTSPAAETPAEVVVDDPVGARDGATGADPQGRAPAAP